MHVIKSFLNVALSFRCSRLSLNKATAISQAVTDQTSSFSLCSFRAAAASQALCENHQPGREQEEQEGDGEEGRAGEREAWSGEHEEEQTTGHQVSTGEKNPTINQSFIIDDNFV